MGIYKSLFIKYILQVVVFIVLLFSGSFVFMQLEKNQNDLKNQQKLYVRNLHDSLLSKCNISQYELNHYMEQNKLLENMQGSITLLEGLELSFSIAFTVGWGYIVPTTKASKIFFIFYSCMIIAMATSFLKTISDILLLLIHKSIEKLETLFVGHCTHKQMSLKSLMLTFLLLLTFLMVTASTFTRVLQLDWVDSFYLTFQAYTTIGFGDVRKGSTTYIFVFIMFWNSTGMSILATFINGITKLEIEGAEDGWIHFFRSMGKGQVDIKSDGNEGDEKQVTIPA